MIMSVNSRNDNKDGMPAKFQADVFPPEKLNKRKLSGLSIIAWICMLIACVGASWFAFQYFLVPQVTNYAPDWHGAQWIQGTDGDAPSTYFRKSVNIAGYLDRAFVTIAANQRFYLYINGNLMASNRKDFANLPRAYIYDISTSVRAGVNTFAVRVDNLDGKEPSFCLTLGVVTGQQTYYYGTNSDWKATSQPNLVFPHYNTSSLTSKSVNKMLTAWAQRNFQNNSWPIAQTLPSPPLFPLLMVNPELYEHPLSSVWMSAGVSDSHDAYFVRQVTLPSGTTHTWMRIAATGTINVFINGTLLIGGNYAPRVRQDLGQYFDATQNDPQYRGNLSLNVYDISPYVHTGMNTLALHISAPGISGTQNGLATLNAALASDILVTAQGQNIWLATDGNWHISYQAGPGWEHGSPVSLAWSHSVVINRPGLLTTAYLSNTNIIDATTPRSILTIPTFLTMKIILLSVIAVLSCWFLISCLLMRVYRQKLRNMLEKSCLGFLPALACEALLIGIATEPSVVQPFPYTALWGAILCLLVGIGYLLVWLHVWAEAKQVTWLSQVRFTFLINAVLGRFQPILRTFVSSSGTPQNGMLSRLLVFLRHRVGAWLRLHWPLIPVVLIAIPLIFYQLSYEPYWQDEVTSYDVAKAIMTQGLPFLPGHFLYPKGELYSYLLAFFMMIFGDQNAIPRAVSAIEYVIILPVLYTVGCYFFNRRIAWLATLMQALSPLTLVWGRQVRMYQQAQLLTLFVIYFFYRAVQERSRVRFIYFALGSLLLTYLSHEETFILIPAIALCVLVMSKEKRRLLPSVFYQKHWWYASAICGVLIGIQLFVVHATHPPVLGTDTSQRSVIQLTADNIPYYFYLLFFPSGNNPALTGTQITGTNNAIMLNSLLATVGCVIGVLSKDKRIGYCAWFFILGFLSLVLIFTLQADRYFYPLVPMYYLLGAYALLRILRTLWYFACHDRKNSTVTGKNAYEDHSSASPLKLLLAGTLITVCICVLITPMFPLNSYNLFVSRALNQPYYHHYVDYNEAGLYVRDHWQRGDIVISFIPDHVVAYYAGHTDYFTSIDHALFLFERDGHVVDVYTGNPALFNQADLNAVLNTHNRIWVMSDYDHYQTSALKRFTFPPEFHVVYTGTDSIVYLRGS